MRRRSCMRRLVVLTGVVLATVGCGSSLPRSARATTPTTNVLVTTSMADARRPTAIPPEAVAQLRSALDAWAKFPVDGSPRPFVLTSDPVSAPASGFRTVDAKEAFLTGLFVAPPNLPTGPGRAGGYPARTSAQALATMRDEGTPALGAPRPPTPLRITRVWFGRSSFGTDRGTRVLPAWMFAFSAVADPAAVLAVTPASLFRLPTQSFGAAQVGARIGADGRTTTITFVGTPLGQGPCTADYTIDQLASDTAIAILVRERSRLDARSPGVACTDVGYARRQRIVLTSPLGNRVLVDAKTRSPVAIAP